MSFPAEMITVGRQGVGTGPGAARAKMRAAQLERYAKVGRWKPEEDAQLQAAPIAVSPSPIQWQLLAARNPRHRLKNRGRQVRRKAVD